MSLALVIAIAAASHAPVLLRGSSQPDPRPVVSVSLAGVRVGADEGAFIPFEDVAMLTGADQAAGAPFQAIIDEAWRARARLRRGDLALAAPLLERLDAALSSTRSSTALLASAGLAGARAAQAQWTLAVEPAMRARVLDRAGAKLADGLLARLGYDQALGLWAALPPLPLGAQRADEWRALPERVAPLAPDASTAALAAWYARAAALAANQSSEAPEPLSPAPASGDDDAVALVSAMVRAALDPSAPTRASAREELERMLPGLAGSWREAWIRLALGRSLARESDDSQHMRAALELLHIPAGFSESLPGLSCVALDDAATILDEQSMPAEAGALRAAAREIDPSFRPRPRQSKGAEEAR